MRVFSSSGQTLTLTLSRSTGRGDQTVTPKHYYFQAQFRGTGTVDSERPLHLPRSYWCYDPGIQAPDVNPLPAMSPRYVTFASLNNFCKASPAALKLWAGILQAVPSAQLILHAWPGEHREQTRELFASQGVDAGRLRFFDMLSLPHYFRLHHAIDVALDSFPYPGGTTTCDALWMGVPTVSLFGQSPFTRSGLSILSNVGLPELAVDSQQAYLETAVALAGDLPRLAHMRSTMRRPHVGIAADGWTAICFGRRGRLPLDLARVVRGLGSFFSRLPGATPLRRFSPHRSGGAGRLTFAVGRGLGF